MPLIDSPQTIVSNLRSGEALEIAAAGAPIRVFIVELRGPYVTLGVSHGSHPAEVVRLTVEQTGWTPGQRQVLAEECDRRPIEPELPPDMDELGYRPFPVERRAS